MKDAASSFNADRFAYEVFPDEVVVLDVIDGAYYSLGGSMPVIWSSLISGHAISSMSSALAGAYGVGEEAAAQQLGELTARLREESIIADATPADTATTLATDGTTFSQFTYEKHVDMQDLLTLDPIHDVDRESGWPNR
ncbi:MAG: PqqD family protein [Pseudomonadota bacterium]